MKWNFPSNNGGEIAGLNGGVELNFAGSPLESLARKICKIILRPNYQTPSNQKRFLLIF